MANVAVATISTTAYASVSSITITKPSGLTAGDLMLAIVHKHAGDVNTCSLTGWTTITSYDDSGNTGDYSFALYKIADAADVAAANFTFTLGETKTTGGSILRITNFNNINVVNTFNSGNDGSNNTNQIFSNTITPTENGLIILSIFLDQATTQSTYSITNNNPTWTEVADQNDGASAAMAIAWAYRPELTSTGNWGSVTVASAKSSAIILDIGNAPVTLTDTVSETDTIVAVYGAATILTDTITESDTVIGDETEWFNTDKNTSTWTNQNKS